MASTDFIADLKYKTTEEGGRKGIASSGYRPTIKFHFDDYLTSGQQTFIGQAEVQPGESVSAEVQIIAVDHFRNKLSVGDSFEFTEGPRIIGTGVISKIINKSLEKPAYNNV